MNILGQSVHGKKLFSSLFVGGIYEKTKSNPKFIVIKSGFSVAIVCLFAVLD